MFDFDSILLVLFAGPIFFQIGYNYHKYLVKEKEEVEEEVEEVEEEYEPEGVFEAYEICSSLFKYL